MPREHLQRMRRLPKTGPVLPAGWSSPRSSPRRPRQASTASRRHDILCGWLLAAAVALPLLRSAPVLAQAAAPVNGIYTCVDERGRRLTSDRPIPECNAKEQRVLNRDGSLRTVRPPTLTAEERFEQEARDRQAAEQRTMQADAARRDRNLLQRYRSEAAHQKAREAALESVRTVQRLTRVRLADLARDRKPLLDEAEFYKGRNLPARLRQQLDANDAAIAAQNDAVAAQDAEIERINRFYDIELERLRKLWAGAAPGSLGALSAAPEAAAPATRAAVPTAPPRP